MATHVSTILFRCLIFFVNSTCQDVLSNTACKNNKLACFPRLIPIPKLELTTSTNNDIRTASRILTMSPMAALVWVVFTIIELTLFILVFRKAEYGCFWRVKNHTKLLNKTHDIMVIVARDSTSYFTMWVFLLFIQVKYLIAQWGCTTASVFTVGVVGVVIFVVAETVDFTTETDSGFVLDFTVACPRITAN